MYDINYFSIYKKRKSKNNGLKIFILIFVLVVLIANAIMIGGGLYLFGEMNKDIQNKENWINNPETQDAVRKADQLMNELRIITDYHDLIRKADQNLMGMKQINTTMLNDLRAITPIGISYVSMSVSGRLISINCQAQSVMDVFDFYHALEDSSVFVNVVISTIVIDPETENAIFSVNIFVKGE